MGGKKKTTATRKNEPAAASISQSRIEQYYNKIVAAFIVLTAVLLVVIFYFSFSKTSVAVRAAPIAKTIELQATLEDLDGLVLLTDVEGSKEYTDVRSTMTKTGKSGGTVTLYNNYTQNQPLVATTRLLSAEGVLFRTAETVTVPAGGSVDVPVIADVEGVAGDIGPTTFEIVALWEGLKKDIYGKSTAHMTGGQLSIGAVTEQDIEKAHVALTDELLVQGTALFQNELTTRSGLPTNPFIPTTSAFFAATISEESNASAGDEVSRFTVTQHHTVAAPVVNKEKLLAFVKDRITTTIGTDFSLFSDITAEMLTLSIDELRIDEVTDTQSAAVTISVPLTVLINNSHVVVNPEKLTNKTAEEVRAYLTAFPEIESVTVEFSPFWIKRTPALADHIDIQISAGVTKK